VETNAITAGGNMLYWETVELLLQRNSELALCEPHYSGVFLYFYPLSIKVTTYKITRHDSAGDHSPYLSFSSNCSFIVHSLDKYVLSSVICWSCVQEITQLNRTGVGHINGAWHVACTRDVISTYKVLVEMHNNVTYWLKIICQFHR
jgi:hypothetical protein